MASLKLQGILKREGCQITENTVQHFVTRTLSVSVSNAQSIRLSYNKVTLCDI